MPQSLLFLIALIFALVSCKTTPENNESEATLFFSSKSIVGEGAIWDYKNSRLLWVDIESETLNILDTDRLKNISYKMNSRIGTVVPVDSNHVVVALEDGIYSFNLKNQFLDKISDPEPNKPTNRFNDGKCDPSGRFWVGTMSMTGEKKSGALYKIDLNDQNSLMIDSVSTSNGIVWSLDKTKMFYIDTRTRKVMQYNYIDSSGTISNPKIAVEIPDHLGAPDGSTIDENGHIWIAMWGGSTVTCWNPNTGELLRKIPVPAKYITSCAFGGSDLSQLFITTARKNMTEEELLQFPEAGSIFVVDAGVKGVKCSYFKRKMEL